MAPTKQPLILLILYKRYLPVNSEEIRKGSALADMAMPTHILSIFFYRRKLGKNGAICQYAMFTLKAMKRTILTSSGN